MSHAFSILMIFLFVYICSSKWSEPVSVLGAWLLESEDERANRWRADVLVCHSLITSEGFILCGGVISWCFEWRLTAMTYCDTSLNWVITFSPLLMMWQLTQHCNFVGPIMSGWEVQQSTSDLLLKLPSDLTYKTPNKHTLGKCGRRSVCRLED